MKFIKINETKLKIEVTLEDLQDYDIKFMELSQGSEKIRELIHTLMLRALDEVDFTVDDKPLLIEAVPRSSYAIDIFVTKVDEDASMAEHFGLLDEKIKKLDPTITNRIKEKMREANKSEKEDREDKEVSEVESGVLVFSFNDLDYVISACHQLDSIYKGKSALYKYEEVYYLYLDFSSSKNTSTKALTYLLKDFGELTSKSVVSRAYLTEHGEVILKANVVKKLSSIMN